MSVIEGNERRRHGRSGEERSAFRRLVYKAWLMGRAGTHVLLVDCIPDDQQMYSEYLRLAGFDTIVTCDVAAAFEHATSGRAKVIVIDTGYTMTNGLELIRRLRDDARTRHAAIIVISGHVFPSDRAAAMTAGCDVFLPKPCLPETLVGEITQRSEPGHPLKASLR